MATFLDNLATVRADRLIATLLLLQARPRVTAAEVARELEVSQRTARRDLEALGMAGIPVVSWPGRGGGWALLGGGRTDLSGLSAPEARALFLVAGIGATQPGGASPELARALRKLAGALPETLRTGAEAAARAVVVDSRPWDVPAEPPPGHLEQLKRAVIERVQVRIGYASRDQPERERIVHPLGLVSKGTAWYLVAGTDAGQRTFRVSRIRSLHVTETPAVRPVGFDLEGVWQETLARLAERRLPVAATVRVAPDLVPTLRAVLGTRVGAGRRSPGGRMDLDVQGPSSEIVAAQLAGFGGALEVLGPPAVRGRLAQIGAELTEAYGAS